MLKVGYMQFAPRLGDIQSNLTKVVTELEDADADLVVLPELAFSGYAFRDRDESRRYGQDIADSSIVEELRSLCARKDLYIVTGFDEVAHGKIFNSSLLIGPSGIESHYRKLYLFNTEKDCFDPGDLPLEVVEVKGARIGMMICFDWIFPEVPRKLALMGADIICHPSNLVIPGKCNYSMVTRCIENRVFAITCNRYGSERDVAFLGGSQIVAPGGKVLRRSPEQEEDLFICEIDPTLARDKWINSKNNLFADRRTDLLFSSIG